MVDSFENAVLKIVVDYGVEIVNDRRKFLSYLTDIAFDYRKEIKILFLKELFKISLPNNLDTAFSRCNNVKLVFEHEWLSDFVKYCDSNKLAHAGLGAMEEYFAEYAKIRLSEKEKN